MVARRSEFKATFGHGLHWPAAPSNLTIVLALSAAVILMLALLLPVDQVLPMFSIAAIAASVLSGAASYLVRRRERAEHPAWHVAALFMLLGAVAGMLSGPEQVMQLFGIRTER